MNEQEIIAELSKQVVQQAEEKVRITQWTNDLFEDIDNALKIHFDENDFDN